jgi:hypothetical protein
MMEQYGQEHLEIPTQLRLSDEHPLTQSTSRTNFTINKSRDMINFELFFDICIKLSSILPFPMNPVREMIIMMMIVNLITDVWAIMCLVVISVMFVCR